MTAIGYHDLYHDGMDSGSDDGAKYVYNFWRPITAIRNADVDGNPDTVADPEWTSLLTANNHPEYPSAHSYQAGAAAEVLAATFGTDTPFSIESVTLPNVTRTFDRFSQAAAEIGESRIYGGYTSGWPWRSD